MHIYEIDNSNGFLKKKETSGIKLCTENISLKNSLKDCSTVIIQKRSVI